MLKLKKKGKTVTRKKTKISKTFKTINSINPIIIKGVIILSSTVGFIITGEDGSPIVYVL